MPLIANSVVVQSGENCPSSIIPGSAPEPLTVSERARDVKGHILIYADDQPNSPVVFARPDDDLDDTMEELSLENKKPKKIAVKPKRKSTRKSA